MNDISQASKYIQRWPALADPPADFGTIRVSGLFPWLVSRAAGAAIGADRVNFIEAFGISGSVFYAYLKFGIRTVIFSRFRRSECELVTLRTAWICGSEYEWHHHYYLAQMSGFSPETIDRVAQGPEAEGWSPRKRAILRAVDEILSDRSLSGDTRAVLSEYLNTREIAELCILVAHYQMLATYLKALGITPETKEWRGIFRWLRRSDTAGRIMPLGLEKLNKSVINHVARLFAGKIPPFALLTHTGRKSGREYSTPLQGYRRGPLMAFPLGYGERTDWARNLLHSGQGQLRYRGAYFAAVNPVIVDGLEAEELDLPLLARVTSRIMKLMVVTLQEQGVRPPVGR